VEAGDHSIEMRYRPWSVYLGAAMTSAAALIALRCLIFRPHRSRSFRTQSPGS